MIRLSILALCYNHEAFLDEALASLSGLPDWVQVLIADDASTDRSAEILRTWELKFPLWSFVYHQENKGNCQTFNELLGRAKGNWILDFATDDVLLPEQLPDWIAFAEKHPDCGFCYADAWIFERGKPGQYRFSKKSSADLFREKFQLKELFRNGIICPPAVLFSRKALLEAGGYNEALSYEDLDIWLRIARIHPVCPYQEPVVRYRKHPDSMSARVYLGKNRQHLQSTLRILQSVTAWPELKPAPQELVRFIRHHFMLCCFLHFRPEAEEFYHFLKQTGQSHRIYSIWLALSVRLPALPKLYVILKYLKGRF